MSLSLVVRMTSYIKVHKPHLYMVDYIWKIGSCLGGPIISRDVEHIYTILIECIERSPSIHVSDTKGFAAIASVHRSSDACNKEFFT